MLLKLFRMPSNLLTFSSLPFVTYALIENYPSYFLPASIQFNSIWALNSLISSLHAWTVPLYSSQLPILPPVSCPNFCLPVCSLFVFEWGSGVPCLFMQASWRSGRTFYSVGWTVLKSRGGSFNINQLSWVPLPPRALSQADSSKNIFEEVKVCYPEDYWYYLDFLPCSLLLGSWTPLPWEQYC